MMDNPIIREKSEPLSQDTIDILAEYHRTPWIDRYAKMFDADIKNYHHVETAAYSDVVLDEGELARQTLQSLKGAPK